MPRQIDLSDIVLWFIEGDGALTEAPHCRLTRPMQTFRRATLMGILAALTGSASLATADISLYVSAPGIQTAEASGLTYSGSAAVFSTETFSTLSTGSAPSSFDSINGGTYTLNGSASINANNQYGGFGQGNYLSVNGTGATETISFASGINYFGFLWTAGDAANQLSFYTTDGALIASYSTANLLTFLPDDNTTTKTAVNGEIYYTGNYYGQPTATGPVPTTAPNAQSSGNSPTQNTSEPYAYLHFINNSSTQIGSVVIEKTVGGGDFESDNHSVSVNAPSVTGAAVVLVQGTIPEPSSVGLIVLGGLTLLARRRRS
jgi:hypothetical protein